MGATIIETICRSCSCDALQAQEYLDGELRNLRDLRDMGDLRHSDLACACSGLGLDMDYVIYFIEALA